MPVTSRYASRKFIVALLILIAATWALSETLLTSADYTKIVIAVIGLYGISNVAQKALASDAAEK